MLHQACEKLQLSARTYNRIIKIARTIADLDGRVRINSRHLREAIGYRRLIAQPALF